MMHATNVQSPGCSQLHCWKKGALVAATTIAVALVIIGILGLTCLNLGIPMSGAISNLAVGGALLAIGCPTLMLRRRHSPQPLYGLEGPLPPMLPLAARRQDHDLPQPCTIVEELTRRLRAANNDWYTVTEQLLGTATIVWANAQPPNDSAVDCHDRLFIPIGPGSPQTRPYIILSDGDRDALSTPGHQCSPLTARRTWNVNRVREMATLLERRYQSEIGGSFAEIIYAFFDRAVATLQQEDDEGNRLDVFMNPRDPATLGRLMNDMESMPKVARMATALLLRGCEINGDHTLVIPRNLCQREHPFVLFFSELITLERGEQLPNPLMDNPTIVDTTPNEDGILPRGLCLMAPFRAAQRILRLQEADFNAFLDAIRHGNYNQLDDDFLRTSQLIFDTYLTPYLATASREKTIRALNPNDWRERLRAQFQIIQPSAALGEFWTGFSCYFASCLAQLSDEERAQFGQGAAREQIKRMRAEVKRFMNSSAGADILGRGRQLEAAKRDNATEQYSSEVVMRALAYVIRRPIHIYVEDRPERMRGELRDDRLQPDMIFNAEAAAPPIRVLASGHCRILREII